MIFGVLTGLIGVILSLIIWKNNEDTYDDHMNVTVPSMVPSTVDEPVYVTVVCGKSAHRYCPFRFRSLQNLIGVTPHLISFLLTARVCIDIGIRMERRGCLLCMCLDIDSVLLSFIYFINGDEYITMTSTWPFLILSLQIQMELQYQREKANLFSQMAPW